MLSIKKIFSLNIIIIFSIIIFVYYFFVSIDGFGPGDDLSNLLAAQNSNLSIAEEIQTRILERNSFSRPISIVINVLIHKFFGFESFYYYLTCALIWIGAIFFTSKSLNFFVNEKLCKIFFLFGSFPFFATNPFQSPYLLSAYQSSILFWSVSLYFLLNYAKSNKLYLYFLGIIFLIISILTFEIILPLIAISFIWPYIYKNLTESFDGIYNKKNFLIFAIPICFISILFFIFKVYLIPIITNQEAYGFSPLNLKSILQALYCYYAVIIEIPLLLIENIKFIFTIKSLIVGILIIFFYITLKKDKADKNFFLNEHTINTKKLFNYSLIIFILITPSIFLISSYPAVTYGFNNKMLISFFIIYTILPSMLFFKLLVLKKYIILFTISFLWINSFVTQVDHFSISQKLSEKIIKILKLKLSNIDLNEDMILFANLPHYLKNNFNNERVFSHTWSIKKHLEKDNIIIKTTSPFLSIQLLSHRQLIDTSYNPNHHNIYKIDKLPNIGNYYYFQAEENLKNIEFEYYQTKESLIKKINTTKVKKINNHKIIFREKIRILLKNFVYKNFFNK